MVIDKIKKVTVVDTKANTKRRTKKQKVDYHGNDFK